MTVAVEGTLVQVYPDDVTIRRDDPQLGDVLVHLLRVGYAIKELDE